MSDRELDGLAAILAGERSVTVPELFACIGRAASEMSVAMEANDRELGEGATSVFLNALAMLPEELRVDLRAALSDRSGLHPRLQRLAL